jgi:Holliday junction resolvase RusA-like endonuclease
MHHAVIQRYRDDLQRAFNAAGIPMPIEHPIDLSVLFVNPTSPDIDNLLTALLRALDGKTLRGPSCLADDGLISKATVSKFYPGRKAA